MNSRGGMFVAFHLPFLGNGYQGPGLSSTALVCGLVCCFSSGLLQSGGFVIDDGFHCLQELKAAHTARAVLLP